MKNKNLHPYLMNENCVFKHHALLFRKWVNEQEDFFKLKENNGLRNRDLFPLFPNNSDIFVTYQRLNFHEYFFHSI
jgi:hypothetical protein